MRWIANLGHLKWKHNLVRLRPDGSRYFGKIAPTTKTGYGPRTIYSIDKKFELTVWADLTVEERSYLGAATVALRTTTNGRETRYLHFDRLGSLDETTKHAAGAPVVGEYSFDPFGRPRAGNATLSSDVKHASDRGVTTDHGFTGHEQLVAHYLTHMNGRVYDYRLGRFLSVDPTISSPANSQSLNPHSYIGKNPLSEVDPTGYYTKGSLADNDCKFSECATVHYKSPLQQKRDEQNAPKPSNGSDGQKSQPSKPEPKNKGSPPELAKDLASFRLGQTELTAGATTPQTGGDQPPPTNPDGTATPPTNDVPKLPDGRPPGWKPGDQLAPNEWVPGKNSPDRHIRWYPKLGIAGQSPPILSWDPGGHWDHDDGKGTRTRWLPGGGGQVDHDNKPIKTSIVNRMKRITPESIVKLRTAAVIIFIIVDEGSRLFPPRNVVPVP